jgi:hypothetical protein
MSFFDNDRIRYKNRFHNEAFSLYEGLKTMGYDNTYIIKYAEFAQQNTSELSRNEVFRIMISIARNADATDKNPTI